ncbi:hypothetical protein JVT61DRAFT_11207 [Boletus reticuloceps]|uniref:Uncharacterized protein n=1 Tax=Boletus reticuloceps TaxID=495285 RepID=A0A8I2YF84_9AGAM|nr:hypothetical protein JVT61DRAFT_11207 [Boletus reticuloceps]
MRITRLSASVLAIAGLMGTNAAPTSEAKSDNTGRPMPTELHRARDDTYLDATRTRPLEGGRLNARLYVVCNADRFEGTLKCHPTHRYRAQNVGPDEMTLPTAARAVETLGARIGAEVPAGSGSKWAVVMVQNMQGKLGFRIEIELSREYDHSNRHETLYPDAQLWERECGGGYYCVGTWEGKWVGGGCHGGHSVDSCAVVLLHVTMVFESESIDASFDETLADVGMSQRMRESFENAVERVQKGHAGVSSPSQWTVPVKPGEMWTMPLSPLPRAASDDGYSPVHRSGTIHACPWRTP